MFEHLYHVYKLIYSWIVSKSKLMRLNIEECIFIYEDTPVHGILHSLNVLNGVSRLIQSLSNWLNGSPWQFSPSFLWLVGLINIRPIA